LLSLQREALRNTESVSVGNSVRFQIKFVPPGSSSVIGWLVEDARLEEAQIAEAIVYCVADRTSHPRYFRYLHLRKGTKVILITVNQRRAVITCDITGWRDPEEAFPEGSQVRIQVLRRSGTSPELYRGNVVVEDSLVGYVPVEPAIGRELDVSVANVLDYGAFFPIPGHQDGMVHRSSIVEDTTPNLGKYLKPGDRICVRCKESSRPDYEFEWDFVRLIRRSGRGPFEPGKDGVPISLTDQRVTSERTQYKRSGRFASLIVEAFNHTCAICGISQRVSEELSAAEAAHIIPRAHRGGDNLENGLCLCKLCHWAFDEGIICVDSEGLIEVSCAVCGETALGQRLTPLEGRPLSLPENAPLPMAALDWHRRNVFTDEQPLVDE